VISTFTSTVHWTRDTHLRYLTETYALYEQIACCFSNSFGSVAWITADRRLLAVNRRRTEHGNMTNPRLKMSHEGASHEWLCHVLSYGQVQESWIISNLQWRNVNQRRNYATKRCIIFPYLTQLIIEFCILCAQPRRRRLMRGWGIVQIGGTSVASDATVLELLWSDICRFRAVT